MSETRVFFVTDSFVDNEELHSTLEAAQNFEMEDESTKRIRVCLVRNAFKERSRHDTRINHWNYEDFSDTFETIKTIEERV